MSKQYLIPPLIEAVCEIRFKSEKAWDPAYIENFFTSIKTAFPKRKTAKFITVSLNSDKGQETTQTQTSNREQFLSDAESSLVQIEENMVAINSLAPYLGWESFRAEIVRGFRSYCEIARPKKIARIGLRYINRIEIPKKAIELPRYFSFHPNIPKLLKGRNFTSFITGILLSFDNEKNALKLQLRSAKPEPVGKKQAVVLDLDYFTLEMPTLDILPFEKWLKKAHNGVEQAFESSITPTTRKLFGGFKK